MFKLFPLVACSRNSVRIYPFVSNVFWYYASYCSLVYHHLLFSKLKLVNFAHHWRINCSLGQLQRQLLSSSNNEDITTCVETFLEAIRHSARTFHELRYVDQVSFQHRNSPVVVFSVSQP